MSAHPYRSNSVSAPVMFIRATSRGCLPSILAGVILGGAFAGTPYVFEIEKDRRDRQKALTENGNGTGVAS